MPRRPARRALARRSLPPRPPAAATSAPAVQPAPGARMASAASRPARLVEREAYYLRSELRRIATVTGTCIGLLLVLVVVDRFG